MVEKPTSILVCSGTECVSNKGLKIHEVLEKEVLALGLGKESRLERRLFRLL